MRIDGAAQLSSALATGLPAEVPPAVVSRTAARLGRRELVFYGEGWEYFRVWIANVALTLATLGLYSP